jgi:hypothetical protein
MEVVNTFTHYIHVIVILSLVLEIDPLSPHTNTQ